MAAGHPNSPLCNTQQEYSPPGEGEAVGPAFSIGESGVTSSEIEVMDDGGHGVTRPTLVRASLPPLLRKKRFLKGLNIGKLG